MTIAGIDVTDWDHFRYFLALARAGRLNVAAKQLNVEYTTIARHIQQLEKSLGQALFIRDTQGYSLTESGKQLMVQATIMEAASLQVAQKISKKQTGLAGVVRVGVTEGFGTFFLASDLAGLTCQYPELSIDLVVIPRLINLSKREADIVITIERPERGPFIMTKLTDYQLKLYASAAYLDAHPPIKQLDDLKHHTFVSYIDDLLMSQELNFLPELGHPARVSFRSTSLNGQLQAVKRGAGLAILPKFLVNDDPDLINILPEDIKITRTFWMLMLSDLKGQERVDYIWRYIKERTKANIDIFMD